MLAGASFIVAKAMVVPHNATILDFDYFYRMGGRGLIWICLVPLNALRKKLQLLSSVTVSIISRLAKNPLSTIEIPIAYVYQRITKGSRYVGGYSSSDTFNENLYRKPVGVGIFIAIILLLAFALVHLIVK